MMSLGDRKCSSFMGPPLPIESITVLNRGASVCIPIIVEPVYPPASKPRSGPLALASVLRPGLGHGKTAVKILAEEVRRRIDQRPFSCFRPPHSAVDPEAFKYL